MRVFRSFDRARVEHLLIGGQAAILFGAAQFTQDVDVWVRPTGPNVRALLRALARVGARVHRLTPPVTLRHVRRGHGFHFVVPGDEDGEPETYLDVMGRPPRVGAFGVAARRAQAFDTPWGVVRAVAIEDLVELKKTDRPGDYEVISRLARLRLARERRPRARLVAWALAHAFRVEDFVAIVHACAPRLTPGLRSDRTVRVVLRGVDAGRGPTGGELDRLAATLAARALACQKLGRAYWRPLVSELRELRARGGLVPRGTPVSRLLP